MSCHAFKLFINNVHWLHLIGSTVTASTNISNSFCTLWLEYIVEISQSSPHRFCKSLAYFHLANYRFSFCYVSLRRLQQALPFGTKHCSGTSKWIKLICKENFELQGTEIMSEDKYTCIQAYFCVIWTLLCSISFKYFCSTWALVFDIWAYYL